MSTNMHSTVVYRRTQFGNSSDCSCVVWSAFGPIEPSLSFVESLGGTPATMLNIWNQAVQNARETDLEKISRSSEKRVREAQERVATEDTRSVKKIRITEALDSVDVKVCLCTVLKEIAALVALL